jgi:hypothetical protein
MREVQTRYPSFPAVETEQPLAIEPERNWQVLCGDRDHWRVGIYSPAATSAEQIAELEQHDCAELFCLLAGKLTLLVARNRQLEQLVLEPGRPVLVDAPHAGFCPDGPHSGRALVVERDSFDTRYAAPHAFATNQTLEFEPVGEE